MGIAPTTCRFQTYKRYKSAAIATMLQGHKKQELKHDIKRLWLKYYSFFHVGYVNEVKKGEISS